MKLIISDLLYSYTFPSPIMPELRNRFKLHLQEPPLISPSINGQTKTEEKKLKKINKKQTRKKKFVLQHSKNVTSTEGQKNCINSTVYTVIPTLDDPGPLTQQLACCGTPDSFWPVAHRNNSRHLIVRNVEHLP